MQPAQPCPGTVLTQPVGLQGVHLWALLHLSAPAPAAQESAMTLQTLEFAPLRQPFVAARHTCMPPCPLLQILLSSRRPL